MAEVITSYPAVLGAILQFYRKKQSLSQGDIARGAGVNTSTWSRIENGETAMTVEQLVAAAAVLSTTPSDLLQEVQDKIIALRAQGVEVTNTRTEADDIKILRESFTISLAGAALAALFVSFPFGAAGSSISAVYMAIKKTKK